jgi:hypothetical protein
VRAPLTPGQLALLQRIANATDPFTSADSKLAVSVYALRARRLVSTKSPRQYWSATITDEGRSLLDRAQQPPRHHSAAPPGDCVAEVLDEAIRISAADLVNRIQHAGGELRVVDPSPPVRAAWRRALHAARESSVPDGLRLRHTGRNRGDLLIQLVPTDAEVERPAPSTIPVPTRLPRELHPIVAATREVAQPSHDGWINTMRTPNVVHLRVTRASLNRVLRIAHAVFRDAERRGHLIETMGGHRSCAGAAVAIDGQRFELTFTEHTARVAHVPTPDEEAHARKYEWAYAPKWDYIASGRLVLRPGHTGDRKLAADGVRWQLEDRLGPVLDGLEQRSSELNAAAEARAAAERERLEREQSDWEEAMRSAQAQLIESNRVDHLTDQVDRWDKATKIRAFVSAVRAEAVAPDCVEPKTEEWLRWASDYADAIDPTLGPLYVPAPPQSTPAALERFLGGWSAHGPSRIGRR